MTAYQKMGWSSIGKGLLKSSIYFTYKQQALYPWQHLHRATMEYMNFENRPRLIMIFLTPKKDALRLEDAYFGRHNL
jgi:hypothetical protein